MKEDIEKGASFHTPIIRTPESTMRGATTKKVVRIAGDEPVSGEQISKKKKRLQTKPSEHASARKERRASPSIRGMYLKRVRLVNRMARRRVSSVGKILEQENNTQESNNKKQHLYSSVPSRKSFYHKMQRKTEKDDGEGQTSAASSCPTAQINTAQREIDPNPTSSNQHSSK